MILLALDTSENTQGLAILEDGQILAERKQRILSSHTQSLLPTLQDLLRECSIQMTDLSALAVTIGPGSFTGLRIGLSTIKALALSQGLPVLPVGTLLALGAPYLDQYPWVAPCMDARMGEVYGAVYQKTGPQARRVALVSPRAWSPADFSKELANLPGRGFLVGSGLSALPHLAKQGDPQASVDPVWVARLALDMYKRGEIKSGEEIQPAYLRVSTAEARYIKTRGLSVKKAPGTVL